MLILRVEPSLQIAEFFGDFSERFLELLLPGDIARGRCRESRDAEGTVEGYEVRAIDGANGSLLTWATQGSGSVTETSRSVTMVAHRRAPVSQRHSRLRKTIPSIAGLPRGTPVVVR